MELADSPELPEGSAHGSISLCCILNTYCRFWGHLSLFIVYHFSGWLGFAEMYWNLSFADGDTLSFLHLFRFYSLFPFLFLYHHFSGFVVRDKKKKVPCDQSTIFEIRYLHSLTENTWKQWSFGLCDQCFMSFIYFAFFFFFFFAYFFLRFRGRKKWLLLLSVWKPHLYYMRRNPGLDVWGVGERVEKESQVVRINS